MILVRHFKVFSMLAISIVSKFYKPIIMGGNEAVFFWRIIDNFLIYLYYIYSSLKHPFFSTWVKKTGSV